VTRLEDLAGLNVCTQTGSTSLVQLNSGSLSSKITITEEVGSAGCVRRLVEGTVDAVSTDQLVLQGHSTQQPDKVAVVPGLTFGAQERYGVGLPHGDTARCEEISTGLRELLSSSEWESLFRQNFPNLDPSEHKPNPTQLDPCP
jgi:glutamate transport system substrate-binding protein